MPTANNWGSLLKTTTNRRFKLTVTCIGIYTALLVAGYLDSGAYVALQTITVGAYLAANGAQKYSECKFNVRNPL